VEIREHVGAENFFLFGMTAPEVDARRAIEDHAAKAIAADPRLARALDAVRGDVFSLGDAGRHAGIADNLSGHDYFCVCSDFSDYWRAQREADAVYADRAAWVQMAARNTARCGWFSSDRSMRGYLADIWHAIPALAAE
jgi:starch phosphorylase